MGTSNRFRSFFKRRGAGTLKSGPVMLGDAKHQLRVALDPGLPDDAYRRLFALDLSLCGAGVLVWDEQLNDWRQS